MSANGYLDQTSRITLMVMISAMVLTRSSAEAEPVRKLRSTFFSSVLSESYARNNSIRHSKGRNGKETDSRTHGIWDMEPLIVKLNTVIEKYEVSWEEVKKAYRLVELSMHDRYGETQRVKYKMPKGFKCSKFKRRKKLKRKIVKMLSKFHFGVHNFYETFQNLTALLERCSGEVPKILKEFKNEFKMLNIEIETLLNEKKPKKVTKKLVAPLSCPTAAHLQHELITLQVSEIFLSAWKVSLSNAFTCWNKTNKYNKERLWTRLRPGLVAGFRSMGLCRPDHGTHQSSLLCNLL